MKKLKIILVCIMLAFILCGCMKIEKGYIVDKQENTELADEFFDYEVPKYIFFVQECVNGKECTNKWYVSKKAYNTYEIDDYVTLEDVSD